MFNPENPNQTAGTGTDGEVIQAGADNFVKAEDKAWFENLLDQAEGRPLTSDEKQKIADKLKGYDSQYSKERNELRLQKQEVAQALAQLKEFQADTKNSNSLSATKREGVKALDNLIENTSDSNARESLRQLREIIRQETDLDSIRKEMTELRQSLQGAQQTIQVSRQSALSKELADLEKRYGEGLVGKHRDDIIKNCTQFPSYSARKMLHMVADEDEIEQAIELQARKKNGNGSASPARTEPKPTSTTQADPAEKYRGANRKERALGFKQALKDAVLDGMGKVPGLGKVS
jgi:predicted RNA binding protein with dsRBD fold (UPF0201 family)